jgi:hypothetical protein
MARFFGRSKNQAEMDFRRFEQEIYINSSQRPSHSSQPENEEYYQEYDSPAFSPRLSTTQPVYENREPRHSLRQERFDPRFSHSQSQPHLRPNPELRHTPNIPPQENELYHFAPQQNYRPKDYRQASRQDELKGLGFWQDEEDNITEDSEEWVERPSPFKFIIALLGLTLMVSIVWFGYRWLSQPSSDGPPLLQAEPGPFKVKPENPGGVAVPYQDKLIYGRISPEAEAPVERLLPPPEQAEVSSAPNQQVYNHPNYQPPGPQGYQQHSNYPHQPPAYQGQRVAPPQSHPGGPSYAPSQQQQGYYPPHQSSAPVPPGGPSYSPPPTGESSQQPANSAPVPLQPAIPYPPYPPPPGGGTAYPPYSHAGQNSYHQSPNTATDNVNPSMQHPAYIPEEAHAHLSQTLPTHKLALYIQLGTLPTEGSAKQELSRLRKKYYHEIGNLEGSVRSFDSPEGKKNFRVLIGPFRTRNDALTKCSKLGSTCRVVQIS